VCVCVCVYIWSICKTRKRVSRPALFKRHVQWLTTPKKDLHCYFLFRHGMPCLSRWHVRSNSLWLPPNNFFLFSLSNATPNLLKFYISPSFFFYLVYVFLFDIFLFELFYKIKICFQFNILLIF
jgi:hypothetical protein